MVEHGSRSDDLHNFALHQPHSLFGVFGLLADGHLEAGLDELVQIAVQRVIGETGQGNGVFAVFVAGGEGYV